MKLAAALTALLLALPVAVRAGDAGGDFIQCNPQGSQTELNACAGAGFGRADAELNQVWKAIQARYADQPQFLSQLKTAQQAWLVFRDAELAAKFPLAAGERANVQYGSVFPMCESQFKAELTRQRVAQLKVWLDGVEEGEVCSGSVKLKE
ncbi:lysozyme inhibitor LprI family protein [Rhodanobacter sp. AS-Z3]|uniref:lysozyme inhibitor LprI family protein n=1 Tax=Rhodanobacter sp. AS-Z3 TaxID=3031330 RepID=UPI002479E064|nr:lysozyme inhibitor LprI family protein [Rhodanobacter sp. AS-Z3]WEN16500.1 lysozyme inhibitor LprI family protein [Rhodanobacter sp. AS-Z3]